MNSSGHYIEEDNISRAWAKAFLLTVQQGEVSPLIVTVTGFSNGRPHEDKEIRKVLDRVLEAQDHYSCHTTANSIFPAFWRRDVRRSDFYARYHRILPRLRRHRANRNGIYFERMIDFGTEGINQVEHVIETWRRGNRRRSALFVSIVDPRRDHTHQRQRGFPCLLHIAFSPEGTNGLNITGFYGTQYMFERAYGNYLGLCRLGRFIAAEFGLEMRRMTCVAAIARYGGVAKSRLLRLVASLDSHERLREETPRRRG